MKLTPIFFGTTLLFCFLLGANITANAATTITYEILTSEDDTYCNSLGNNYTVQSALAGRHEIGVNYRPFLRWAIDLSSTIQITYAAISVRGMLPSLAGPGFTIALVDTTNCEDFSTNPNNRAVNATMINWSPPPFADGTWYATSNISSLVQIFINKPGYTSGNHMGIRIDGGGGGPQNRLRTFRQYDYDSSQTNSSAKLVVTYNQIPPVPTPLLPLNNSSTYVLRPTFVWNRTIDADGDICSYTWELDTTTTYNSPSRRLAFLMPDTTYIVGSNLASGVWYWHLRSHDNTTSSAWCSDQILTIQQNQQPSPASLLSPLDGTSTETHTPTFIWSESTDPEGDPVLYRLQVDNASDFNSPEIETAFSANTEFTPGTELNTGLYYWRVFSQDTAYAINTSTTWNVFLLNRQPGAVNLLAPSNGLSTLDHTPTFIWSQATDPDAGDTLTYQVQVDDNADFSSPEYISSFASNTEATPISELSTNFYYWRVISQDTGLAQNTTAFWSIIVLNRPPASVTLIEPLDITDTTERQPLFIWNNATDPDGDLVEYQLQIDNTADFSSPEYISSFGSATEATPGTNLLPDSYYWRVLSQDTLTAQNTSATRTLVIRNQLPDAVTLLAPGIDTTNNRLPLFIWEAASDPDSDTVTYKLQIDNTADFSSPEFETMFSSETETSPGTPLAPDTYSWRVISQDAFFTQNTSAANWFIAFDTVQQRVINSSDTYTFYLGTWDSSTDYTPVVLTVTGILAEDTVTISLYDSKHPNAASEYYLSRWARIQSYGQITSAALQLNYTDSDFFDADFDAVTEDQIEVAKWDGLTWSWSPGSARDTTANWIQLEGITSFSDWTLGAPNGVPVELSQFSLE